MTDAPWTGDASSLVEAFRSGDRSPAEEMEATLTAAEATGLNCFSHLDPEQALAKAAEADTSKPFGGVPMGVKELDHYEGWPATQACLLYADEVATDTSINVARTEERGGAVPFGLTTASEFGGLNVSNTRLNGITGNPWNPEVTPGGSSGGSASAVAAGICSLASGGDGGGSIRIPAGFCGLPGLKTTAGRIPRGPNASVHPMTVVTGVLARSIRDLARHLDVASGYDPADPYSLPRREGWEANLGSYGDSLRGRRAVIAPDLGVATVNPEVARRVREAGEALAADAGLELVDVPVELPGLGFEWAMGNLCHLRHELGDDWRDKLEQLTRATALGLEMSDAAMNLATMGAAEAARTRANATMAELFGQVDFIISATNPDTAFPARLEVNTRVAGEKVELSNNGALTIPYNIVGNPAITLPVEQLDGLPVGMQVATRHHAEELLLDLGAIAEAQCPWPMVVPNAPV
ncbi:MAG: amidase [Microthrixaceae bacterium]